MDAKKTTLEEFCYALSEDGPAPGSVSAAAYCAALGASLLGKAGSAAERKVQKFGGPCKFLTEGIEKVKCAGLRLLDLVKKDSESFDLLITALTLPKGASEQERNARWQTVQEAYAYAIDIVLEVINLAWEAAEFGITLIDKCVPDVAGDAMTGLGMSGAALSGAAYSLKEKLTGLKDADKLPVLVAKANEAQKKSEIISGKLKKLA